MLATILAIYAGYQRWSWWTPLAVFAGSLLLRLPTYSWWFEAFGRQRAWDRIPLDIIIMLLASYAFYGLGRGVRRLRDHFRP